MAESYSVTAILSAVDKNFSSVFGSAQGAADSLAGKIKSGLGFGVLTGIGMKAFSTLTSAASGFAGELESTSAAWKTFEDNFNITSICCLFNAGSAMGNQYYTIPKLGDATNRSFKFFLARSIASTPRDVANLLNTILLADVLFAHFPTNRNCVDDDSFKSVF